MDRARGNTRIPGLDGIRALAVLAVLAYHGALPGSGGGFLGVEVFFVLSGFLISGLLLSEWNRTAGIGLLRFWSRRGHRLLPAVYLMIPLVLLVFGAALPGTVAQIRSDALAGLGYVTNWWLVFAHKSYFATFARPSPFTHLWSLAIEEQFYLLWPLALLLALPRIRRQHLALATITLALGSLALMAVRFVPGSDPSAVYYSSDTRASGLLAGAALALFCWPALVDRRRPRSSSPRRTAATQAAGWLAVALLAVCCTRIGELSTFLYRGGFGVVDAVSVLLIYVVVAQPAGLLTRTLGLPVLRWLGLRSYGIYVWHWPIFVLTRPGQDLPFGVWPVFLVRLAATLAVAELSYRFVELPVRSGALGRRWADLRDFAIGGGWRWLAPTAAVASLLVASSAAAVAVAQARPQAPPRYLAALRPVHVAEPAATAPVNAARRTQAAPPPRPCPISAIGDSVLLGALPSLRHDLPQLKTVDAQIGMQVRQAIALLSRRARAHELGCAVVLQVGDNGPLTEHDLGVLMGIVGPARLAVFITDHVPLPWADPNNRLLSAAARKWRNFVLVDWARFAGSNVHFFYGDNTHLAPAGQLAYARLVASALHDRVT